MWTRATLLLGAVAACSGEPAPPAPAPAPVVAAPTPERPMVDAMEPQAPSVPAATTAPQSSAMAPPAAPTGPALPRIEPAPAPVAVAPPAPAPPAPAPPATPDPVSAAAMAPPAAPEAPPMSVVEPDPAVAMVEGPEKPPAPKTIRTTPAPEGFGTCTPDEVEGPATQGELTAMQRGCMELAIGGAGDTALRNRLSLALITDADAKGDQAGWGSLVERHLTEIDGGNPSLSLRFALSQLDAGASSSALTWAEQALAHRSAWTPNLYTERTYTAYKLQAAAAQGLWRESRSAGADAKVVQAARLRTAHAAQDWATYAEDAGLEAGKAVQLCKVAGGDC